MKEYLQLDGVAYKLVPIRTLINPRNPYEMGRVDSEKMYKIAKNWDWGNMEDPNIYHDPETRKNSITYRSNLGRLIETLIAEKDTAKAKEMLDLAMEKMPIDYYGYYTLVEPYISGYFEVGEAEKAKALWTKIALKYQENLKYYAGWDEDRQYKYADDIITDMERYRSLIDLLFRSGQQEFARQKAEEFNNYLKLFPRFYDDSEVEESEPTLPTDSAIENEFKTEQSLEELDSTLE